jgi:pimeloyl-ACP methyl ester carboxylesterase
MRTFLVLCCLTLLAACAHPQPAELAQTTSYALAREHGRFVSVGGLHMFAITRGTGRDVVLLHGNPASTYSWRKVIEPLAARYRVHAVDLPGYGFSDKPKDASYDVGWQAQNVVGYLTASGIDRAVLVGHSMGGHIASETAITYPEKVTALVLLGASGLPTPDAPAPPLAIRMATWPVIGPILRELPGRGRIRDRLRGAVYDPAQITEADVDALYAPLRTEGGTRAYLKRMQQQVPVDRPARVQTITAPTLVITGDSDRRVPPEVARRYHDLIAGSELLVLAETGHLPQEERPDRVVAEITRWIDAQPVRR